MNMSIVIVFIFSLCMSTGCKFFSDPQAVQQLVEDAAKVAEDVAEDIAKSKLQE